MVAKWSALERAAAEQMLRDAPGDDVTIEVQFQTLRRAVRTIDGSSRSIPPKANRWRDRFG